MARQVMDTFSALGPHNEDAAGIPGFNPDWERIFGSTLAAAKSRGGAKAKPRPNRRDGRLSSAGLRDEITEDENDG
jgi:hypothetical protein